MTAMGLTKKQKAGYDAIVAYFAEHGRSPSYNELAAMLGYATKSRIHFLLCSLKERGYVDWLPYKGRSLRLLPIGASAYTLPRSLQARLEARCRAAGDNPADYIIDAVAFALDADEVTDEMIQRAGAQP
jgi:SOS-response transcriptional repressor LexA